jgi:hypothetical protein
MMTLDEAVKEQFKSGIPRGDAKEIMDDIEASDWSRGFLANILAFMAEGENPYSCLLICFAQGVLTGKKMEKESLETGN